MDSPLFRPVALAAAVSSTTHSSLVSSSTRPCEFVETFHLRVHVPGRFLPIFILIFGMGFYLGKFVPYDEDLRLQEMVQGVVWMVLSLLGILSSVHVVEKPTKILVDGTSITSKTSPVDLFNTFLLSCYFPEKGDICCNADLLLSGDPLLGISIVYLVASFIWLCISVLFLQALVSKKDYKTLTLGWAALTCLISLLDFVVAILFGVDYSNMNADFDCAMLLAIPGLLMSLAARGYLLWLINVASAIWLGVSAAKGNFSQSRRSSRSSNSSVYNSPADAVHDSRSMVFQKTERPWVADTRPQHNRNPAAQQQAPPGAWDRPDAGRGAPPPQGYADAQRRRPSEPPPHTYLPEVRGGLARLMTQNPPSNYGSQRGPPSPLPPPPQQQQQLQQQAPRRPIPDPDYDAGNPPRRSALKKAPSTSTPALNDWRPQSNYGPPMSPDGRGGWHPSSSNDNRNWQGQDNNGYDNRGYDNRGYDNRSHDNRSQDNRGQDNRGQNNSQWQGDRNSNAGRWGRTGF